jgi:hypothetical protein
MTVLGRAATPGSLHSQQGGSIDLKKWVNEAENGVGRCPCKMNPSGGSIERKNHNRSNCRYFLINNTI